ncbi:class I adenylate-forming enzyme family protein [Pseudonocardia kunmingensis]|uniref:Acyl-CoA synthetase (AMP-forming)/AMP-acid ligase II n=1 Tax=Pseudonocardia kunmingensis TaxID=630975 RepID=A0A543DPY7_9PSEU|nr:class I adenylate-forming enzyme family protein [Pseudonocardia kunmingensis]TQM11368.1 acyl-CoA synthetase (AMP-forming)/AMP-acid ligase II [Pseudonocardia kunmingensis]
MGIRDRLTRLLREAPAAAEAIEHEGAWWTWGDVRATAQAVTDQLDAAGLGAGSRVGVVLENRPEHVAITAAVIASGRCLVTLSPLQPAARLAADIERSDVPVVVAGADALARDGVLGAVTAHGLALELGTDGTVREVGGAAPVAATGPAETEASPVAIEMLTSGTTGPPKRVHLSVAQLDQGLASGGQVPKPDRLLARSASLVATPLVHIGGLWGALACLHTGRRMILMAKFVLEPWVGAVERHRLRAAGLVPAALRTVLDADVPPNRLASLQVVTSGTAPCPAELADAFFRKYGIRVLMTYGATEFAGAVAGWTLSLHEQWWHAKAGSAGRAFPGVTLRVTGADGAEVPQGESGQLEVRTRQTAQGADTWVRTSDLARIDADGFVWIEGRADDAIIRGGFKVAPDTVKRVLETHPGVREAAVAGLPDTRLGAVPVAAVEIEPGQQAPRVADLVALCRAHLTPYEVPAHVLVLDELPRTPSSKVSRVELLDLVRAQLAEKTPA